MATCTTTEIEINDMFNNKNGGQLIVRWSVESVIINDGDHKVFIPNVESAIALHEAIMKMFSDNLPEESK